jgi:hypothetical protein
MRDVIWYWPELPELPLPGRFVLICVRTGSPRAGARLKVRAVLRQILAAWSQLSPDELPLKETPRGPVWESRSQEDLLATSMQSGALFPPSRPSPQGRGSTFRPVGLVHRVVSISQRGPPSSCSPREGAGVRGNEADNRIQRDWISVFPTGRAKPG